MTIKHKSNMSFDHAYLAKLESGKEPLPTGVYKTSSGYGYRISKSFKGKDFRFGTFQSLEHALRTNEFINRFLIAVNEELEKKPVTAADVKVSLNDLSEMITGQNEILERYIKRTDKNLFNMRIEMIESEIIKSEQKPKKSLFQRIFNL